MPLTPDGCTSLTASLPNSDTSRARSHGSTDACRPAPPSPYAHGPSAALFAQRPVRINNASPAPMRIPELLPGLKICHIDRRAGLKPFDLLEQRHVDENGAGYVAGTHSVGGGFSAPRGRESKR